MLIVYCLIIFLLYTIIFLILCIALLRFEIFLGYVRDYDSSRVMAARISIRINPIGKEHAIL